LIVKYTRLFLIFLLLTSSCLAYSQVPLQVEELPPYDTPLGYKRDTLVKWVLEILEGYGGRIDTSTIKYTGAREALGRYYDGNDIGLNKGLIISNGRVESAEGPNSTGSMTDDPPFNTFSLLGEQSGDPTLLKMYNNLFEITGDRDTTIHYTGDAAVLEFKYQPYGDQILMDYVFGSEEYPSSRFQGPADQDMTGFPDTPQIFDLFGVFIDMNPNNHDNLAILDNTTNPATEPPLLWVHAYSVNQDSRPSYYKPNPDGSPPFGTDYGTQFDGLTRTIGEQGPLKVEKKDVNPCGWYNVKIAIEDFYWTSPDPEQLASGFQINSALFLGEKSLSSSVQLTGYMYPDYSQVHEFTNMEFEGDLIEGCDSIEAVFTLEHTVNGDYHIPYKIFPTDYSSNIQVEYEDGTVITNDTILFLTGETEKKIIITAINLTTDAQNVALSYPENPCDFPGPFGGGFSGRIPFNLRQNIPISFTKDPKIYEAFCKETIDLTITDITQNGVEPLAYLWNGGFQSHDTISYQVQNNPDMVTIVVNDGCGNESNVEIQIDNKSIDLVDTSYAFLCGPGQDTDIEVPVIFPDYSDYSITHVRWYKISPFQELGEADSDIINVVYDDVVGADIWYCGYEVTDICGGTQIGVIEVNQSKLTLGDDVNICNGESIELIAYAEAQSFMWIDTINPLVTLSDTNFVVVSPSLTTVYALSILDNCNETQTAYITVFVDQFVPQITISPSSAEICPGDPITLEANDAVSYHWSPGDETTKSITLNPTIPDEYQYTLTASSEYCIDKVVSASFKVFPTPVAEFTFNPFDDACTGESISFFYSEVGSNETFVWDFDDGSPTSTLENPTHTYTTAGTYFVKLHVNKDICDNDTLMQLIINPLPGPQFDYDQQPANGCLPVEVDFYDNSTDVSSTASYEWTFGDGESNTDNGNTSHTYTDPGLYTVSLQINNTQRCSQSITRSDIIQANPNPVAGFEPDPPISTMDTPIIDFINLTVSDSAIDIYEWNFGDNTPLIYDENPSHTYAQAGGYDVILYVTTINGCIDSIGGKVALTEEVKLFIPNAFTPNGDGVNDVFEIKGTPVADFNLYIYSRWGQVIWSTHTFTNFWDGTDKNGSPVPTGSYVYKIVGTDYLKQSINYNGTVTVVK
jgi:gliding motility-associated-like protein